MADTMEERFVCVGEEIGTKAYGIDYCSTME